MTRTTFIFGAILCLNQLYAGQAPPSGTTIDIDFPSSRSGPVMGLASFSGWVLNTSSTITSFSASIDGVPLPAAIYGSARPDVCALFNGSNCPNVGWSLSFDTTQLPTGSHTLTITTVTASGEYAAKDAPFIVANWMTASANPMRIAIDSPNAQSAPLKGTAIIGGWALSDLASITDVSVAVDSVGYGHAVYGASRPDACGVFPNRPGCPNIGWNFALDTSTISDGPHTLAITSTASTGAHYTMTTPFSVGNFGVSNPTRISIDVPNLHTSALAGSAAISGWALDDISAITAISAAIDGRPIGAATYGNARPDVCAQFPGRNGCPDVGWNFVLDTSQTGDGSHLLQISAHTADGRQTTAAMPFSVNNSTWSGPVKVTIDQSKANGSTFTGTYLVTGSALDDNAAISSLIAVVDGIKIPIAAGLPASTACIYHLSAPSCPNAGWSIQMDTNALANGSHTLSVVAIAADGQHAAAGLTFNVANWTAANPMTIDIDVPSANSKNLSGTAAISGWAFSDQAVLSSITVFVDGINFGYAVYGDSRADVCRIFPGKPGCPAVGWHGWLDTTLLANGAHKLTIVGTTVRGEHSTGSVSFTVSNPTRVTIDSPNSHSGALQGTVGFGGWALNDNNAVARVVVLIDGIAYPDASYGVARTDVCKIYSGRAGCPNVGWGLSLDTTGLANGAHSLQITAISANGQQASAMASFSVEQQGSSMQLGQRGAGRILEEATWGPTAASLQELQSKGFDRWFQDQVSAPVSSYADQPLLTPEGGSNSVLTPVTLQFYQNSVSGPDQLRQRMAFALSEMWVVSANAVSNASAYPPLLRIFQNGALDNYENLMGSVTLNPAMGKYLDMVNNFKADTVRGTSPNENFARELMQLMTIGLVSLNQDGTQVLDGSGSPIPAYTQADVTNLAKALTGWTYASMPGVAARTSNPAYYLLPMVPSDTRHDQSAKQFLGVSIPAGNSAQQDLAQVLHILFMQPGLPPFVCKQLIQHLVTSDPSPAYIARVVAVFLDNGHGTRGDLTAVAYAILADPEARAGDIPGSLDQPGFGHLREPILYTANLARALNITLASGSQISNQTGSLGQTILLAPSVFSYFSPFYTTSSGMLAPEMQLYTTQAAPKYADLAYSALYSGKWDANSTFNLAPFIAAASNAGSLIGLLNTAFLHGAMSDDLKTAVYQAMAPLNSAADKARAALYTVLTSGDYLIIH